MSEFYEGEYIIYRNGEKYELGRITSLREDGAFVCYNEGETAAKTPYSHMHKLVNAYAVKATSLGGDRFAKGEMRLIDGDALMMHLADWWYSSFGEDETDEAKAIYAVMDQVEEIVKQMSRGEEG